MLKHKRASGPVKQRRKNRAACKQAVEKYRRDQWSRLRRLRAAGAQIVVEMREQGVRRPSRRRMRTLRNQWLVPIGLPRCPVERKPSSRVSLGMGLQRLADKMRGERERQGG